MNIVPLKGYLTAPYVEGRKKEIHDLFSAGEREVTLAVSSDGGLVSPTVSFIDDLLELERRGLKVCVRIQNAKSMALVLALSFGGKRTMKRSTLLEFHLGSLHLEATDFDHRTGAILSPILVDFRRYEVLLQAILDKYGISKSKKMMAELYGSNWLSLNGTECLRLGLVDELF
jgi:ATP-dependent protease ClpP protease subunit